MDVQRFQPPSPDQYDEIFESVKRLISAGGVDYEHWDLDTQLFAEGWASEIRERAHKKAVEAEEAKRQEKQAVKQAAANRESTIKAIHAAGLKNITITLPDGTTFRVSADDTKPESADEDLLDRL